MISDELTLKYVFGSNFLDGVTLTLEQTQNILQQDSQLNASEEFEGTDGQSFEVAQVTGHRLALLKTLDWAVSDCGLKTEMIRELHEILMGEVSLSAGEYRECQLRIKGLLIPSPAGSLGARMKGLTELINNGLQQANLDKHRLAWRVHHEFFTIHPFVEGNGRIARLLLNFIKYRDKRELAVFGPESRESYGKAIIAFQKQKIARMQARKQKQRDPQ